MTTKKQMRERVAAKRLRTDAAYRAEGQAALARSRDRDLQKQFDKEREENKKKAAVKIAAIHAVARHQNKEEFGDPAEMGGPEEYSTLIVDDR